MGEGRVPVRALGIQLRRLLLVVLGVGPRCDGEQHAEDGDSGLNLLHGISLKDENHERVILHPTIAPLRRPHLASALVYSDFVSEATMQVFRDTGAYLKGHFRLTSGLHSDEYLQCALVLQHPKIAERFGRELAARLGPCDVVASPAIGGLIIGHEVARALGARFIFSERDASGTMTLRRGFSARPGESAAVIEDVVTTGGSTREVIELLRAPARSSIVAVVAPIWACRASRSPPSM